MFQINTTYEKSASFKVLYEEIGALLLTKKGKTRFNKINGIFSLDAQNLKLDRPHVASQSEINTYQFVCTFGFMDKTRLPNCCIRP